MTDFLGHGGLFKTKGVGQQILADAVNAPVSVMSTAGEGGAWGIALLAAYLVDKKDGETLDEFLDNRVFAGNEGSTLDPEPEGVKGFNEFMDRYLEGSADRESGRGVKDLVRNDKTAGYCV